MTGFEWGERLPELEGRNVRLRALTQADVPALLAIFGDAAVMRFWSSPALPDLAAAAKLLDEIQTCYRERRLFQWGISFRERDEVFGTCTLYNIDPAHRRAEIGFALRQAVWGRGFATDALSTLLGFAFETLELHRLEADVDPRNDRSRRVLERQGFQIEGRLRERWHHLGEVCDGLQLGLLRREWRGMPAASPGS